MEWWNSVSLRTKITGVTVFIVTAGLLVAGVGTMTVLRDYLLNRVDENIRAAAAEIPTWAIDLDEDTVDTGNFLPTSFYVALVNRSGELIADNLDEDDEHLRPQLGELTASTVFEFQGQAVTLQNETHTSQTRVVALVAENADTGNFATLVIGQRLDDVNATMARYTAIFLGFALSVVVLSAALTRVLVTSTFRPLREVEATAAAIAGGDFSQRLPGATPNTEVGRLNRSLNVMLGRIDRAFADRARTIEQMRRFVGDASHELRTPLVSVRGYAELYRMGAIQKPEDVGQAMERIEKEAIRMGELVEDLLELARADEKKPLRLAPVDLLPLAHDAALDAMAQAPDRAVTVKVEEPELPPGDNIEAPPEPSERPATTATGPIAFAGAQLARLRSLRQRGLRSGAPDSPDMTPLSKREDIKLVVPAVVLGEENKLRQVITNLLGNALRFTPDGSPIELVVRVDAQRRIAQLDIVDHGEGVPPQIREKIFQRFWRADTSRTRETGGSGLGLAIVAAIVDAHKGDVRVHDTEGGGATFRLTLPLLPDSYVSSPPKKPEQQEHIEQQERTDRQERTAE
ncbi:HAMP domain-containing histidine kinase [Salinibacterium sp. SYSU T00001]|uniref:sensor histidine kinase n=1 Tax=Homoserinimonas sedimenticola TaxID=2986805 RepID=UPI002235DE59|nr:HAMP domain-containing sensor histidine kinase [Salinibacterium sedimenticola]MCW4386151.1 HAMP domain-containing histidine kinase [Salinibacterium sedimenticola]